MQQFVKVANDIFEYHLSPKAVFVYVYLSARIDRYHSVNVKLATIASNCNMNIKTVQSAIKELAERGFIRKVNRYNYIGYKASKYYVKNLLKGGEKWFKVPVEVFKTTIKSTDFVVFLYIRKCMCNKKSEAFPSLTVIHEKTKISRGRVSQAVQYLRNYTFINRIKRHYKRTKRYRHNRYMQFKLEKRAKRKARTVTAQTNQITNYIVSHPYTIVKRKTDISANLQFVNRNRGEPRLFLPSGW